MPNIHAINVQDVEYGLTAENGITQAQAAKIETIGDVASLTTENKQTAVSAINEVNAMATGSKTNIGDMSELITSDKTSLVAALNSSQTILDRMLDNYGKNVSNKIPAAWITDIANQIDVLGDYDFFSIYSGVSDGGFMIGTKRPGSTVRSIFMYKETFGIAFRENSGWSMYSILDM